MLNPHLANLIFNQPHLCTPQYAETVLHVLGSKIGVDPQAYAAQESEKEKRESQTNQYGTYVLPIQGSMVHKAGFLDAMSGVQSYGQIQANIEDALNDPQVKTILLDMDSPGGSVSGVFDLRDYILEAKKEKPIYALSRDSMASAAYLIGSACDKVYTTQTGSVGSIGVVAMHVDQSKANEERGIKPTFIYAGDYKIAGNPHEKLEGDALNYLQESVNDSYEMFVNAVAEARGVDQQVIRDTEAREYRGKKAVAIGLADGVRSFEATLKELAEVSPKRVTYPTMSKGMKMDKDTVEKLEADFTQLKANHEDLQAKVLAAGFKITKEGLEAPEVDKEPEMIEVAGVMTDKATLPAHVVEALETAQKEKAEAALKDKASAELPNFKLSAAMSLVDTFADNEEVMQALKAADALLNSAMEEKGETQADSDMVSPKEKFDALVEDYMTEHSVTIHKARTEVGKTPEGLKLQTQIKKEG